MIQCYCPTTIDRVTIVIQQHHTLWCVCVCVCVCVLGVFKTTESQTANLTPIHYVECVCEREMAVH